MPKGTPDLIYIVVVVLIAALAVWLVLRQRKMLSGANVEPYRPGTMSTAFDTKAAANWASTQLKQCPGLSTENLESLLDWCSEYVRSHLSPLNGAGPDEGWLLPPNMFDVVAHVRARVEDASIVVDDECVWEVVRAHDEWVRISTG